MVPRACCDDPPPAAAFPAPAHPPCVFEFLYFFTSDARSCRGERKGDADPSAAVRRRRFIEECPSRWGRGLRMRSKRVEKKSPSLKTL